MNYDSCKKVEAFRVLWHIYKALHQYCIIRISVCRTKVLTAVLKCVFTIIILKQYDTLLSPISAPGNVKPATQNKTTLPPIREKKPSASFSLSFLSKLFKV